MTDLPTGTVTFLFTDIAGSTRLWEQHPQAMAAALARHDAIMRQAISVEDGVVYNVIGDAFQAAFPTAPLACAAALAAQRALTSEAWGVVDAVPVRMALHSCAAVPADGAYRTGALNRLGRLLGVIHGGQIVLSRSTADLAYETLSPDVTLRDLGEHHLRDLRPEHIFQLVAPDLPTDFPPLKSLDRHPHNLPAQPTALIGRENEIVTICGLLHRADVRLVTLTGPGGTGKTRLGVQVAAELLADVADGTWFVNLAPVSDPALVAATVAQTLGIKEQAGRALSDSLKDWLREKQLLLLLDNFEQVVEAAPLVSELLAAAPGLNVLATSRIPLHLSGEREFAVPPLGLPPRSTATPPTASTALGKANENRTLDPAVAAVAELTQYAAVQLFIERAQAVKADFAVTSANAPAVAEICYQLDGLPLAIELAAARVKLFPPQALLTRLSSRLKLLTGGARDLPERQQTIRTTIDWSYQLLDADEQTLFRRLGVFVGGCTLEAAEAVCDVDGSLPFDVVEGVATLFDKSLLRQEEQPDGEPRFTMLETIHEYALEQLQHSGEADDVQARHAEYFLAFAEAATPELVATQPQRMLTRLTTEYPNLRAVLTWSLNPPGRLDLGLRLAAALQWFWIMRTRLSEGYTWLERALALSRQVETSPTVRAKALRAAGVMGVFYVDHVLAIPMLEESIAIARAEGDHDSVCEALLYLGFIFRRRGDYARAREMVAEALTLAQTYGDTWWNAYALLLMGDLTLDQGDVSQAAEYFEAALTLSREAGFPLYQGWALVNLGRIAYIQAAYPQAQALLTEGCKLFKALDAPGIVGEVMMELGRVARAQGDEALAMQQFAEGLALLREFRVGDARNIAFILDGLAGIAATRRQPEQAVYLFGAAEALRETQNSVLPPIYHPAYERDVAAARAQLDEATFTAAWAAGRALSLEQAIEAALKPLPKVTPPTSPPQPSTPTSPYPAGLTAREVEVLRLIAQGLTDAQVAERLVLSAHTVHAHLRSIYGKLEVTSRAAATRFAVDHHLI